MSQPVLSRLFGRPAAGREDLLAGPIRGELLGAEHLAERARVLAAGQRLARRGRADRRTLLLNRLDATRRILDEVHARLEAVAAGDGDVTPAGEWFLDNYHVIQEHIREVRESLPRGYYRELPELAPGGSLAGYPRVYELAITLISHSEGRVASDNLNLFTSAFQDAAPLSIGELWSIPAMLRLGLIENVRRMALRTVQRLDEVDAADSAAAHILAAGEQGAGALRTALDDFVAHPPAFTPGFVSRFLSQLRLTHGAFPPLVTLEQWIADEALPAEEAGARSARRLALTQLTMANSITSLRTIGRLDWKGFVERQSIVEATLRRDPAGYYDQMTFATRDRYRHVVERIAKHTGLSERAVAERAVDLARSSR
ncbi:MAG: cyclic beta 1-2 glucan synthetase, partial [Gemmatimonadales bacterium]|nr:cyclic beta 1-2 glucan synthetase [Gemmatimonadales bacterium]